MHNVDLYWYAVLITGSYDGDTVTVDFDHGRHIRMGGTSVRFAYVDTPELRGSHSKAWRALIDNDKLPDVTANRVKGIGGVAAKYIDLALPDGTTALVRTLFDREGKYGRPIAEVYAPAVNVDPLSLTGLRLDEIPVARDGRMLPGRVEWNDQEWANLGADMLLRGLALSVDW